MDTSSTTAITAATEKAPEVFVFPDQEVGAIPAIQGSKAEIRFSFQLQTALTGGDPTTDYFKLVFESAFGTPADNEMLKCSLIAENSGAADAKIATTCEFENTLYNSILVKPIETVIATQWYELAIYTQGATDGEDGLTQPVLASNKMTFESYVGSALSERFLHQLNSNSGDNIVPCDSVSSQPGSQGAA